MNHQQLSPHLNSPHRTTMTHLPTTNGEHSTGDATKMRNEDITLQVHEETIEVVRLISQERIQHRAVEEQKKLT